MKYPIVASLALAGALLVPAAHAFAAPINAPSSSTMPLSCDNGQTYTIVTNSGKSGQNGQGQPTPFDPGFIISGDGGKLLPLSFTFIGTDVTTGVVLFSQTSTKGQATHAAGTVVTCTFGSPVPLPNGDQGQFTGTVVALLR